MSITAEIHSLESRLMQALDHEDAATFGDCWTEDAALNVKMFDGSGFALRGRAAIVESCKGFFTGKPSSLRHLVGAVWVDEISATTAQARFYSQYINVGATPGLAGFGEYRDEVVRCSDGRWRISRRVHDFLTPLAH